MAADHVYLNGLRHEVLDVERITTLAFESAIPLLLPEGAGWATLKLGKERFAAWLRAPKSVSTDA